MSQQGRLVDVVTNLETLTGNSGGAVSPDGAGDINIVGTGVITVTGNPGTNTLTIADSGSSITYTTDSGNATPAANVLNVLGGTGISTSGSGSTVTVTLDTPVLVTNGGTGATSLTDGGILLGSGTTALTATAQPTNGQLLIGSTGVDPALATITAGANITVTNAAGSITIAADGGGELAITALTDVSSPYTVLAADEYLSCDVSGGVLTINLPNAPTTGRVIIVKDKGGDAASNNISVTTVGGVVTIDGSTTRTMNTNFEALQFIFNGTSYEVF